MIEIELRPGCGVAGHRIPASFVLDGKGRKGRESRERTVGRAELRKAR